MKILVLDDHAAFRDEVVKMLIRNGHEAHGVSMATSALSMIEGGDYDFVLVDYNMPIHDGLWFMRNLPQPCRTKALLMTAHVNQQVIDTMLKNGVSGYVIKPFAEEALLNGLNSRAESGRPALKER